MFLILLIYQNTYRILFDLFPLEFIIQIYELEQKSRVDLYRPFFPDIFQRWRGGEVVANHHVNDDKCRGSGFAKDAVDKYFASFFNRVIHEFRSVRKMPVWKNYDMLCMRVWSIWNVEKEYMTRFMFDYFARPFVKS